MNCWFTFERVHLQENILVRLYIVIHLNQHVTINSLLKTLKNEELCKKIKHKVGQFKKRIA